jgi:hypothetical protein
MVESDGGSNGMHTIVSAPELWTRSMFYRMQIQIRYLSAKEIVVPSRRDCEGLDKRRAIWTGTGGFT